eukprot:CAMPEP_0114570002 /NCGR_PEP_ID=MMETSP0114-20121206/16955_1 /TAXON_ID=31324 /ORGANISM="Goniomonas sp, Strain m" /LENGTH=78 /DNA_ID=CAMNT_0001756975 /DNA_START=55 /DNA_END=287 /DNA_ORIENTATION=-
MAEKAAQAIVDVAATAATLVVQGVTARMGTRVIVESLERQAGEALTVAILSSAWFPEWRVALMFARSLEHNGAWYLQR